MSLIFNLLLLFQLFDYIFSSEVQTRVNCKDERYKCKNNGSCITRPNTSSGYICSCPTPYCGQTCANRIPNCVDTAEKPFNCEEPDQYCYNEGRCISWALVGGFICSCKVGYCGNRCTNRVPNCMLLA